jgi:hypothetical protein
VVYVDDDDTTAQAFALADNRTGDLGGYDNQALAEMLAQVQIDTELLEATGYTESDIKKLVSQFDDIDFDATDFKEIDPEKLETDYRCPSCNYEWSGLPKPGMPSLPSNSEK